MPWQTWIYPKPPDRNRAGFSIGGEYLPLTGVWLRRERKLRPARATFIPAGKVRMVLAWEIEKMAMHEGLYLYEEIMLLALRDKEGTVASGAMYNYAVGGAILAELLLSGHIGIDEPRPRKKRVTPTGSEPMGDCLIDECLGRIAGAKRRRAPVDWVSAFAGTKRLKHRVAEQLCRRGILEADEDNVLLIFTRRVYPEIDPEPERRLIERLRNAIFTDTDDVDPRTVVLVSLASSTNILQAVFNKKELRARRKRIEQIVNGEVTGKAAKDAIAAMQAAVMVACMMPAIMTTTMATTTH